MWDGDTIQNYEPNSLAYILLVIILMVVEDFTLMSLWNWFLVPLGIVPINFFHAVGIDIFVTIIVPHDVNRERPFMERWKEAMGQAVFAFFLGLVIQAFI